MYVDMEGQCYCSVWCLDGSVLTKNSAGDEMECVDPAQDDLDYENDKGVLRWLRQLVMCQHVRR
jgi:hypothetical protein